MTATTDFVADLLRAANEVEKLPILKNGRLPPDAATGMPKRRLQPPLLRKEVETCGLCHARRDQLSEDWVPGPSLSNTHRVSPLDRRPAFARASALAELGAYVSGLNVELARSGLSDRDPMVRIGALDMLEGAPADRLWPMVSPLLSDQVRGVRLRAVSLLAMVPAARQPTADRGHFDRAAEEFIAA